MTMNNETLIESLEKVPIRETGGSVASNRFDYQKDWTICQMIDLLKANTEFVIICEYHEDVCIVDSPSEPSTVSFHQIKTKRSGNWTVNNLVKREKGRTDTLRPSILGRLYLNKKNLAKHDVRLWFCTNAKLSIKLTTGKKDLARSLLAYDELSDEEKGKIKTALETEWNEIISNEILEAIGFEVSELPLDDHSVYAKGKLVELLEQIAPESTVRIPEFYRTLFDEVKRRTNQEKTSTVLIEVCKRKGICRSDFETMIHQVVKARSSEESWRLAHQQLTSEKVDFREIRAIQAAWRQFDIDRLDPSNLSLIKARTTVLNAIEKCSESGNYGGLMEMVEAVVVEVKTDGFDEEFSKAMLRAMAIWEIYEDRTEEDPVSETCEKPEEENK